MTKTKNTRRQTADPLVNLFFHSFIIENRNGEKIKCMQWQGRVLVTPAPGIYLVQLFEWLFGTPINRRLVKIDEMLDWTFYETDEDMREAYDSYKMQQTLRPGAPKAQQESSPG